MKKSLKQMSEAEMAAMIEGAVSGYGQNSKFWDQVQALAERRERERAAKAAPKVVKRLSVDKLLPKGHS